MNISINKPYASSDYREIEIGNIVIKLQGNEIEELFNAIDEELHFNDTRDDLMEQIINLKEEIEIIESNNCD